MIRPVALEITELRGWRASGSVALDRPVTVLVGDNGRGKSSTLAAIEWCLFGREIEGVKGTGIAERNDWEVRRREAGARDTVVRLTLSTPDGPAVMSRRRPAGAKTTTPDLVEVTLPEGRTVEGGAAEAWLAKVGVPDAETFRRAHLLHQDAVRRRVVDGQDRSAILAALLGLEDDRAGRERLAELKVPAFVREVEDVLRGLERDLAAVTDKPRRDRDELERRLAVRGLARGDLSEARAVALRRGLLDRAASLAARLGLAAALPSAGDPAAVRAWAPTWSGVARGPAPALARASALRARQGRLEAALSRIEPFETELSDARKAYEATLRAHGDRAAREAVRAQAQARLAEAEAAQDRAGAMAGLLRRAAPLIAERAAVMEKEEKGPTRVGAAGEGTVPCPVCETPVAGLSAQVTEALARAEGPEAAALAAARKAAEEALRAAGESLTAFDRALDRGRRARLAHDAARAELELLLSSATTGSPASPVPARVAAGAPAAPPTAEPRDVAAAARALLAAGAEELRRLDGLARERDEALARHGAELDTLRELEAWIDVVARLDRDVDVAALPSSGALEAALDEAGGFALDVEAVGAFLREAQAERSAVREHEVNAALSTYYGLIVGEEAAARGLFVCARPTAKRLEYDLVDATGAPAVPVLNQASVNAISLALLCAQAEARARAGGLAWVALDDPGQSLDAERQAGVARAVERLAATCAVLVAAPEGPLVDRLLDRVSVPRRVLRLRPWSAADGASLEVEEER